MGSLTFPGLRTFLFIPRTIRLYVAFVLSSYLLLVYGPTTNWKPTRRKPFLLTRMGIADCLSRRCLHSARFATQGLSAEDASLAQNHIRAYLSLEPEQPPAAPRTFLRLAATATCAVVGGAPLARGVSAAEQSRLVDSTAELTFRLNVRAPELLIAEGSAPPLGTRTDALFIQRGSLHSFERYIQGWGEGNATLGAARRMAGKRLLEEHNPVLVFRPECPSRFASCPKAWEALNQASLLKWTGVHLLHYEVEMLTNKLLRLVAGKRQFRIGADVPSTGIVAIVAAVQMCARVHAFAMNGSVHGDRDIPLQDVWQGHKLQSERRLLHWLASCPSHEPHGLCGKLTIIS